MTIPPTYHDSDADDEYERTDFTSPILPTDDENSPTDTDPPSTEPTPTAFGPHSHDLGRSSPASTIVGWSTEQCADWLSSMGLSQYCNCFLENEIVGEALIALRHDELKEMGIISIGHRLTILKAAYDVKQKQGIPIDSDHWVPPSAEASALDQQATRDDISRIIRSLEIRDHRIQAAEAEIRKITEEYRKLRDELLPIFRQAKDRSQPLPFHPTSAGQDYPEDNGVSPGPGPPLSESKSSKPSRKLSTKRLFLGGHSSPKASSPTYPQTYASSNAIADQTILDPSAAAIAASNHLTAGMNGGSQPSPQQANIPSPTSPNSYSQSTMRSYRDVPQSSNRSIYSHPEEPSYSSTSTFASDRDRTVQNPTPTPRTIDTRTTARRGGEPYSTARENFPSTISTAPSSNSFANNNNADDIPPPSATGSGGPSVEIFKSFRVSMDDPCEKVLPAALKKYNINADWKNYALYIVYGDQERCLGLKEKPLILFKQLDREGKKPMFMLRKHAAPLEGHSGPSGAGMSAMAGGPGGGVEYGGMGGGGTGLGGRQGNTSSIQLPGGVL